MQDIRTKFRLFLFIPLIFILAINVLYIALGVWVWEAFKDKALYSSVFISTHIGVIVLLNVILFALAVVMSSKYIKDDILA